MSWGIHPETRQLSQTVAPLSEYLLAGHAVHDVLFTTVLYVPAGQQVQVAVAVVR